MYPKSERKLIHPELTLDELIYQAQQEAKMAISKFPASSTDAKTLLHDNDKR